MIARKSLSGLNKWILTVLIISWFFSTGAAFEFSQLQWDNGISGTLKGDEIISYMGYSVKVVNFNAPVESDKYKEVPVEPVEGYVGLNISKNGTLINETMLGLGESFITPDGEFKVMAIEFPSSSGKEWLYESYNPWVKLELNQRGKPHFDLLIDTQDEYFSAPNTEIPVNVVLKNTGTADIQNVDMDIGTELPILRGNLKFHFGNIKKGSQVSETLTFSSPIITELKSYDISANVSGFDVKDISYKSVMLKTIFIAPSPQQLPSLKKSSGAKMYLKDTTMVSLSFKNDLNYELKNVSITDYIPKGFKQISNNSLHWLINVPPNGEWYFRYILKPMEADNDGLLYPAAKAEFEIKNEYYMIQSNRPETVVYGPRIELSKQADVQEIDPYGTLTVTVIAVNNGSIPSKVTIKDNLPANVTLVNGTTMKEDYLEANKKTRFSYTIRSDSDKPVRLPAANADYYELGDSGTKIITRSQELLIRIKPPPTPEPTPPLVIEMPLNSTEAGNAQPEKYSKDNNAILNLLLDCNEIKGHDIRINTTSDVCSFVLSTISVPGITVTSPNGGESWARGTTQTIRWTYSGTPGSRVKIELLKIGVANRINSSTPVGSSGIGSYSWRTNSSQTLGTDYKVRVTSTNNSAYTDTSNNNFTISAPGIKVTSPNGGENWARGTTHSIRWTYSGTPGSYVKIELLKGRVLNRTINSSTSAGSSGSGIFKWLINSTQTLGSDYKVRVTSTTNLAYTDTSNNNFTIGI